MNHESHLEELSPLAACSRWPGHDIMARRVLPGDPEITCTHEPQPAAARTHLKLSGGAGDMGVPKMKVLTALACMSHILTSEATKFECGLDWLPCCQSDNPKHQCFGWLYCAPPKSEGMMPKCEPCGQPGMQACDGARSRAHTVPPAWYRYGVGLFDASSRCRTRCCTITSCLACMAHSSR